jgi:hypothetical protein
MDMYMKVVFTVIAIALSGICLQHTGVLPALAQQQGALPKVQLCGYDTQYCVGVNSDHQLMIEKL